MALCLADSLLASGGALDQRDLIERFVRWYVQGENAVNGHCFDIGMTTRGALERFIGLDVVKAGDRDERSAGNGSLMRLSPVAIRWHADPAQAAAAARAQSETTHAAPAVLDACAFFAGLLVEAIGGSGKAALLAPRDFAGHPAIAAIAAGQWRGKPREAIRSSGYVVHTLEAALWSVHHAVDFAEAVLLAANLGDDADTVAAVTGQLAGALWGASAIPSHWLDRLAWRPAIEERAVSLYEHGRAAA